MPPGTHEAVLEIKDDQKNLMDSMYFSVQVVDHAFDHVSRPALTHAISATLALGALVTWGLTTLGSIDMAFGYPAGTAAIGVSGFLQLFRFWNYGARRVVHHMDTA